MIHSVQGAPPSADPVATASARHPAAWRFLLPREVDGPVALVDLDPVSTQNLVRSYPGAVVVGRSAGDISNVGTGVVWDGNHSPLRPATVALLICDARRAGVLDALAPALAPDGTTAAIVPSAMPYEFALFPTPEQLRAVVGHRWPLTFDGSPRRWLGYWLATTPAWRYLGRAGLWLSSDADSVVGVVLRQLGDALGGRAELRGLIAGRGLGQATLRVRCADGELAVRVATSTPSASRLANHQRAVSFIRELGTSLRSLTLPQPVASGAADGIAWAAERWSQSPRLRAMRSWQLSTGQSWQHVYSIAADLGAEATTGWTEPGWASRWIAGLDAVAPAQVPDVLVGLSPIESARMVTAWCHGDLWPGNIVVRRASAPPVVIDWERARSDAPAGMDAVHGEICRTAMARRCTFGAAAAWLAERGSERLAASQVGGRRFADWDRPLRDALLLAATTHYATGENEGADADAWTRSWGELHVLPMLESLRAIRLPSCQLRQTSVGELPPGRARPLVA